MSGYDRVPLNLQQQGQRPLAYPTAHPRIEQKYDPNMTLEEALTGDWYPRNNEEHQTDRSNTDRIQRDPAVQVGGAIRCLGLAHDVNAGENN